MAAITEVTEHLDDIRRARALLGLEEDKHPVETWFALLHVESNGREDLQDRDSYVGPLQIGNLYLTDAREYAQKHYGHEVTSIIPSDKEALRSDAYTSLVVAMLYMERYRSRHDHDAFRMAGIHKGGTGSAKQVTRRINLGDSVREAHKWVSLNWRYSASHKRAGQRVIGPKLYLYVYGVHPETGKREYRFEQALRDYTAYMEQYHGDTAEAPEYTKPEPDGTEDESILDRLDDLDLPTLIRLGKKAWSLVEKMA